MAYKKKTPEERRAEIDKAFKTIEENIPTALDNDTFKDYLQTISKFHNYSINNQLLIRSQNPNASFVAGFNSWRDNFERTVNKGEKGLMILAPSPYKYKKEVEKTDDKGNVVRNAAGEAETETKEFQAMGYRQVYVFDVLQTSGKELPEPLKILNEHSKEARDLLEAAENVSPFGIKYIPKSEDPTLASGAKGYFSLTTEDITISDDLPLAHKAKTLIHEVTHGILHNDDTEKSREQKEIEAEATAFAVCNYFGLDTSDYSFGYVASWSADKEPGEIKGILEGIQKSTDDIITKIEKEYEIVKERNKDLELPEEKNTDTPEEPADTEEIEQSEPSETQIDVPDSDNKEPDISSSQSESKDYEPSASEPTEPQDEETQKANIPEPATKETKSDSGIQDFGQKIGGAKKDLWSARGLNIEDLLSMNDAERLTLIKKDNVWKKPDYQKMVDEGLPREVAYFYKIVRDACPTKPELSRSDDTPEKITAKQDKYVSFISDVRDAVLNCKEIADIKEMYKWLHDNEYVRPTFGRYVEPTEKAAGMLENKLLRALQKPHTDWNKMCSEIKKKQFCYSDDEKILSKYVIIPYVKDLVSFEKDYSGRDMMALSVSGGKTFFYPEGEFAKPENYKDLTFFVLDSRRNFVGMNFENEDAAKKFCLDLEAGKDKSEEKTTKKKKTALKPPMLKGIERVGEDYRQNKNVEGQDYLNEFNFKGGEFGNWLNENERQQSLNFGYDAFKDLAVALNIKPTDVTLNGELSIAFGARGSGNALAHYEPLRAVINLTKMKGAGSLGHEWIHAMDDLLGKQLGIKGFMSDNIRNSAIPQSFKELMDTIKYKTLSPEEAQIHNEKNLNNHLDKFRQDLNTISRKGDTPEKEAKRQELIEAVVIEAKNTRGYNNITVNDGNTRNPYKRDKTPSPAFKAFIDYQRETMNDTNPGRNAEWCNGQRSSISTLAKIVEAPTERDLNKRVETKFYTDALKIDKSYSKSGHGYWQDPKELLARAGAVYIKDKLEEQGIRNDYLNGHADQGGIELQGETIYTSPQTNDRTAINAAFDKFFDEMKELGLFHEEKETSLPSLDDVLSVAEGKAASQSIDIKEPTGKDNLEI